MRSCFSADPTMKSVGVSAVTTSRAAWRFSMPRSVANVSAKSAAIRADCSRLFRQRNDWIDARGAARRQRAGDDGHGGQQAGDDGDHGRIRRADAKQLALE